MTKYKVIFAGASGATGKHVLNLLLNSEDIEKVTTIGRRELEIDNPKLEQKIVNFDELPSEIFSDHDVAICTLGCPRAKHGKEMFLKVERTYVLSFAERCKEAESVKQFHLLSGQGADPASRFLYLQVKGEVDDKIIGMGFEHAMFYRPGAILVKREDSRMFEGFAQAVLSTFDFRRSISVKSEDIAKVMVHNISNTPDKNIFTNTDIFERAKDISI